jgi:tetratricopeptide (TPR) repeat protein
MTDPLVQRVLDLADENLLVRDRSAELEQAIQAVDAAAAERGDRRLESFALARRGLALHGEFLRNRAAGEPPREMELFEQALTLRREIADEPGVAESLFHVGLVHQVVRGDHTTSRPFFQESYDRASALGDDVQASYALRHLAFCEEAAGDFATAEQQHEEALELRRRAGWQAGVAAQLAAVAELRARRGDRAGAAELAGEARQILVDLRAERALAMFGPELDELTGKYT